MKPADVAARVAAIQSECRRGQRWDDEVAHSAEDAVHEEVLEAIANGTCEDPAGCAAEALKTRDLDFSRWCA